MSTLDTRTINALTASLMVEELIRNGIDRFCLAPGSRCTPLTLAVAQNPKARVFKHYDERGLGFFALGLARTDGKPAVVITTSGTAVANLLPAIVEADQEDLPLIILSTDRPPELRDTAANQAIDQVHIFGPRVRWFVDLPCPHSKAEPEYWLHSMDHAVFRARSGPVHVNAMYREPLLPDDKGPKLAPWILELKDWDASGLPYTQYADSERSVSAETARQLAIDLGACRSGVIVVGRLTRPEDRASAVTLAEILGWPLVADFCSGLRLGAPSLQLIHGMDLILQHDGAMSDSPDAVIHLGGRLISKRIQEWINRRTPTVYALCHDSEHQMVPGRVTHRAVGSVRFFCEDLARELKPQSNAEWFTRWVSRQGNCESILSEQLAGVLNELSLARSVTRLIPEGHQLFVGNSMPIRDMEMFAAPECKASAVHANRGASGIDGLLATAAGAAAGSGKPLTLVIGDLSLLHDLNSLNLVRNSPVPITVVVINNDGGGIFSFLPVAGADEVFEEFFGTPHGMQFASAAAQFGLNYVEAHSLESFEATYEEVTQGDVSTLIEVTTQRDLNLADHQAIREVLIERLDG